MSKPDLIGGIGLTHVRVYEQRPAPDGTNSGCAHVHGVTDEAYYVVGGRGQVELHDLKKGFRTVALEPGGYVQFPAGTLHRVVSSGALELLVIMDNGGLAELGDARIYFGPEIDEAPAEFERLVSLENSQGLDGALARRDASARGYTDLIGLWSDDRAAYRRELERFVALHWQTVGARREDFTAVIRGSAQHWLELARSRFDAPHAAVPDNCAAVLRDQPGVFFGMSGILRYFNSLTSA